MLQNFYGALTTGLEELNEEKTKGGIQELTPDMTLDRRTSAGAVIAGSIMRPDHLVQQTRAHALVATVPAAKLATK